MDWIITLHYLDVNAPKNPTGQQRIIFCVYSLAGLAFCPGKRVLPWPVGKTRF